MTKGMKRFHYPHRAAFAICYEFGFLSIVSRLISRDSSSCANVLLLDCLCVPLPQHIYISYNNVLLFLRLRNNIALLTLSVEGDNRGEKLRDKVELPRNLRTRLL
jgi:hypothetical protein